MHGRVGRLLHTGDELQVVHWYSKFSFGHKSSEDNWKQYHVEVHNLVVHNSVGIYLDKTTAGMNHMEVYLCTWLVMICMLGSNSLQDSQWCTILWHIHMYRCMYELLHSHVPASFNMKLHLQWFANQLTGLLPLWWCGVNVWFSLDAQSV